MLKTRTNRIVWSTIAVLAVLPLVHVGYVLAQTPNVKVRAKPPMFSKAFVAEFLPEAREKLIALPLSGGEAATGGPAATPNGGAPGATTVATLAPWK